MEYFDYLLYKTQNEVLNWKTKNRYSKFAGNEKIFFADDVKKGLLHKIIVNESDLHRSSVMYIKKNIPIPPPWEEAESWYIVTKNFQQIHNLNFFNEFLIFLENFLWIINKEVKFVFMDIDCWDELIRR